MSTVAILGASTDRSKYGNKAVRSYLQKGWTVYPVNPKVKEVEGIAAYASITDVPLPVDRVSVYLPPPLTLKALDAIAAVKPSEVFLNPGTESEDVIARATELGLPYALACSILEIGAHPSDYS